MSWHDLLLCQLGPTLYMTGLIWFVQIVHYPLMAHVGASAFVAYERAHTRLTTFVVLPPMLAELVLSIWIAGVAPDAAAPWAWAGLALTLTIWASTFFLQVPCHDRLQRRFEPSVAKRLVRTNWLRTVAWSLRAVLALGLLYRLSDAPR